MMWCNVGFSNEEVLYCIDEDSRGFNTHVKPYEKGEYHSSRFTAKFDFKNYKLNIDGNEYKISNDDELLKDFNLYTNGYGEVIRFYSYPKNYNYYRARVLGIGDSLVIAYGKCSKF